MYQEPKVIVILLNYRKWQDTLDCVNSLSKCKYLNLRIIIIDNASNNDSEVMLKKHLPHIPFFQNAINLGYTGGINFGIKQALEDNPEYILILNSDTYVEPDFLGIMVNAMEKNPLVAIACGTILHYPETDRVWYAGGNMVPWRGLAVHKRVLPIVNGKLDLRPKSVSFITGCMFLIRTSTIQEIGFQDERFFMYLDDIEYSARVLRKGYTLLYIPQAKIYHRVNEMEESPFKLYYSVRNRLLLINTAFTGMNRIIAYVYFMFIIASKLIIWWILKPQFFKAARAGLYDYFTNNLGEGRGIKEFST